MQDIEIEFVHPYPPSAGFIRKLLLVLVSEGTEYNSGKYAGEYLLIPKDRSSQIQEKESSDSECTEKLEEIIEKYSQLDSNTTIVSISLNYCGERHEIPFTLRVTPVEQDYSRIGFWIAGKEITKNEQLTSFIRLGSTIFEKFECEYGKLRFEYQNSVPTTEERILGEPLGMVTFYSKKLAEKSEVERLRLAHVNRFERLENGSVVIVTSDILEDGGNPPPR